MIEPRPLSELLASISTHIAGRDSVSIKLILEEFHERGFGFFLFLLALPAALPFPAVGISAVIAIPLMLLTGQQMLGFHTIWLPERLKEKCVSTARIQGFITMAMPWVKRLELFIRPRLSLITRGFFSHLIGVSGFIMALSVTFPLPLTNTVPSIGICLMAMGVLMRDGLAVIAGMVVGLGWVFLLVTAFILFGIEGIEMVKVWIKSFL